MRTDFSTGSSGDESGFVSGNQNPESNRDSGESGQTLPLQLAGNQSSPLTGWACGGGIDGVKFDHTEKSELFQQSDSSGLEQRDELFGGFGL